MNPTRLSVALCSCLILPLACTKDGDKAPAAEQARKAASPGADSPAKASGANLFDTADLAKLIPSDAVAVGAIAGPERIFTLFGRDEIVAKLGPLYDEALAQIRKLTGQDLLSLAGLKAFGIDPKQPVAMFLWNVEDSSGGVVFGLSDRDALLTSVQKVAAADGKQLDSQQVDTPQGGDATILCPKHDPNLCLLVTASHGYVIGIDGANGLPLAKQLAGLSRERSLAGNADFARALATIEGGADISGYVNLEPIITPMFGPADAQQTGLIGELLGPIEAVVVGADFGQRTLIAQVVLQTQQPFLLGSLIANGSRLNPVVQAMGEDAVMLGSFKLDLDAIWSLASRAAASEGQDLDELDAALLSNAGFGFERDALPALSGELGYGFEADLGGLFTLRGQLEAQDSAKFIASIDGALTIGLTDLAKGRALIEKALAHPKLAGMVERDDDRGQWSVTTPFGKTLLIRVASPPGATPYIVIASTQALLDQVGQGKVAPAFSGAARNHAYAEFIGQPDVAAMYAGRQILLGAGAWFGFASFAGSDMVSIAEVEPSSVEYKKVRKEIDKIEAEIGEIERKRSRDRSTMLQDMLAPWGPTTASLQVRPDGLELRLGQFIEAPSWADLAGGIVDTGKSMAAKSKREVDRLNELTSRQADLRMQRRVLEREHRRGLSR